jgi:hypothetical protein
MEGVFTFRLFRSVISAMQELSRPIAGCTDAADNLNRMLPAEIILAQANPTGTPALSSIRVCRFSATPSDVKI